MNLITNRDRWYLNRLHTLQAKGWANMTASEREEWYNRAAMGAYNYTDLNRVESAVAEIAQIMGLSLTTKTDWSVSDVPTQSEMERYLGNVVAIRNASPEGLVFPALPDTMNQLTIEGANNIEKTLSIAYDVATNATSTLGKLVLGSSVLYGD